MSQANKVMPITPPTPAINGRAMMKAAQELYLEFVNDFITVGAFADFHHISDAMAQSIIDIGRLANNELNQ